MTKEQLIEIDGIVEKVLPNSLYRVRLENDHILLAHSSGRMKKNKIKVIAGDKVTIELTQYDLTKGRIIYRFK